MLNLFDFVRLYETRQSSGKNFPSTTILEAQLIGRGARYCPFQISDEQPKFQRKYDSDLSCDLRTCETLYNHCYKDEPLYKSGIIFLNERVEKSRSLPEEIAPAVRDKIYLVERNLGISGESPMMTDAAEKVSRFEIYTKNFH